MSKVNKKKIQKAPMFDRATEIFILEVRSHLAKQNYTMNHAKRKYDDRKKLWEEVIEAANLTGL